PSAGAAPIRPAAARTPRKPRSLPAHEPSCRPVFQERRYILLVALGRTQEAQGIEPKQKPASHRRPGPRVTNECPSALVLRHECELVRSTRLRPEQHAHRQWRKPIHGNPCTNIGSLRSLMLTNTPAPRTK